MAIKQIVKRIKRYDIAPVKTVAENVVIANNNKPKKGKDMTINEIERAENLVKDMNAPKVKVIKKEKGLIERTETEKVVLTEDNRQVLVD